MIMSTNYGRFLRNFSICLRNTGDKKRDRQKKNKDICIRVIYLANKNSEKSINYGRKGEGFYSV